MAVSNGDVRHRNSNGKLPEIEDNVIAGKNDVRIAQTDSAESSATTVNLMICVGGIYASL